MKHILCIDPSIRNIGFSVLRVINRQEISVWTDGTYKANPDSSILQICEATCRVIHRKIATIEKQLDYIVIEYPQFMMGDKGLIAAQKGYTLDLAMVCGYLAAHFMLGSTRTTYYTPTQWKGQMPKSATLAKFKRKFPDVMPNSEHSCDSAMLGYYFCEQSKLI